MMSFALTLTPLSSRLIVGLGCTRVVVTRRDMAGAGASESDVIVLVMVRTVRLMPVATAKLAVRYALPLFVPSVPTFHVSWRATGSCKLGGGFAVT